MKTYKFRMSGVPFSGHIQTQCSHKDCPGEVLNEIAYKMEIDGVLKKIYQCAQCLRLQG